MREMTKDGLKIGMVIEQRNGARMMVIDDQLVGRRCFSRLAEYSQDLKHENMYGFDIVKIFRKKRDVCVSCIKDMFDGLFLECIWEREEKKRISRDEAQKILTEKFGCEVEVADNG